MIETVQRVTLRVVAVSGTRGGTGERAIEHRFGLAAHTLIQGLADA